MASIAPSNSTARNDNRNMKTGAGGAVKAKPNAPAVPDNVRGGVHGRGMRKASQSNASSRDGSRSSTPTVVADSRVETDTGSRHMHDRLLYLLVHLMNQDVTVVLKNGSKFSGKFMSALTEGDLGVELKDAKQIRGPIGDAEDNEKLISSPALILQAKDVMEIEAQKVALGSLESHQFKTDAEISANARIRERELEKWSAGEDISLATLEETSRSESKNAWDQFEVNERMFGIKSNFQEELYTTRLDKNHPEYKKREEDANRLAREIESSVATNSHIREERGIDDSGIDEEDRYSGVKRPSAVPRDPDKYTPPALRPQEATGPSDLSLQHDPAIVSAQISSQKNGSLKTDGEADRSKEKQALPLPTTTVQGKTSPEIEKEFMGTFKQFVSGERERLQQKKQAHLKKEKDGRLQELMKFSQSFKLKTPVPADLVPILAKERSKQEEIVQKAAASAASVTSSSADIGKVGAKAAEAPVPSTTSSAQGTLTQRLANARNGIDVTPMPPPTPLSPPSASATKSPLKFNVNATEFRPNPSAPAFAPSFTTSSSQSPSGSHASAQASRPPTPSVFFGNKKPKTGHRPRVTDTFNPFQHAKKVNPSITEAQFDKPYIFTPTWPPGENSGDKSYADMFPVPRSQVSSPTPHFSESSVEHQLRPSPSPVLQPSHLQQAAPFSPMYGQQQMAYGMPYGQYRGYAPGFVPGQTGPTGPMPYMAASPYMQFAMPAQGMYSPQQAQMFVPSGYLPGRGGALMMPQNSGQGQAYVVPGGYPYQNPKMTRYPSDMMRGPQGQQGGMHRSSFGSANRPNMTPLQSEKSE